MLDFYYMHWTVDEIKTDAIHKNSQTALSGGVED